MTKRKPEAVRVKMLGGFSVRIGFRTIGQNEWRLKNAASLVKLLALGLTSEEHRSSKGGDLKTPKAEVLP